MKNKNYDIKINKKIPKLDQKINKYYKSIKFDFEGKAYLVDKELRIIEEIKNEDKIKKNGSYLIKFVNKKNEVNFINIKIQKINFVWIILLLILLIFFVCRNLKHLEQINNQMIFDVLGYDYELTGSRYVFKINYGDLNYKEIKLFDKFTNNEKISPGSSGEFYIYINTIGGNKNFNYKLQVEGETNKPVNFKYIYKNNTYNSFTELAEDINGSILSNSNKALKIEWFWDYETLNDNADTIDGSSYNDYTFFIRMIGNEKV